MSKQRKNIRNSRKSKPRRRPRRVNRTMQAQPSIGRLIAKGVKSLVSSVPVVGDVLKDVLDFGFKAFGVTNLRASSSGQLIAAEVANTALVARFHITPACLLVGSRNCVQVDMGRKVMTQYHDGRVKSLSVRIQPTNTLASRSGDWSLAIQPFFTVEDRNAAGLALSKWHPTEQGMHHMYLSTSGPASKPLQITYRPRISDGLAFGFMPLDSTYAEVVVRWEKPIRDVYSSFSANDFACETIISGSLEQRTSASMPPTNAGGYQFDTTVIDVLQEVGMFVFSRPDKKSYILARRGLICQEREKNCLVTGTITDGRSLGESFETLELEGT